MPFCFAFSPGWSFGIARCEDFVLAVNNLEFKMSCAYHAQTPPPQVHWLGVPEVA
jgi:hypothetical protein